MLSGLNLLLVRGAPGIGKTTIGSLFRRFAQGGVVIDIDDVRRMINNENFKYGENKHYINAVRVTRGMVLSYFLAGYSPVVVVDVFCERFLNIFRTLNFPGTFVSATLYANDNILLERMSKRPKGFINLEVAARVNQHMIDTREMTDIWIDTTALDPGESFKLLVRTASIFCTSKYGAKAGRGESINEYQI